MPTVQVFTYIDQLDAFVVTDQYRSLADRLGLTEWHPVVWVGRLFTLDNDYGEHWFDNWDEREALADAAHTLGTLIRLRRPVWVGGNAHHEAAQDVDRTWDGRERTMRTPERRREHR